jgi:uncharacterized membrane protein YoaK (UPF0700 family)
MAETETRPQDEKTQSRPTSSENNPPGDVEANQPKSAPNYTDLSRWWTETVTQEHADIFFILCSLITGLCDGVSYATFGCFISMQTGNTIFVGLGASGLPTTKPYGWLKSLVSICSFFCGSFTFATITRWAGSRQRRTLTTSFAVQSLFILIAAAIIQSGAIPHQLNLEPTGGRLFLELIPLAILAFQFGGQIAAARGMGFNELPTVVLTSVYFDIASDPKLTDGPTKNVKRNRRMGSVAAIVIGAIAAGWLCRSNAEMESALWISGFIKMCIAVAWLFWPPAEGERS